MRMRSIISTAALAAGLALGGAGTAAADADAVGVAVNIPGVLSGNVIQVPVDLDANVCGNTIDVIGLLNFAAGVTCINED
ncbi:chaplin [Streptomyces sp. NPDC012769]|uniref:chaplin n=1 Tax=Streptomyces sp. NPDC012769 TaxID=3364848 RepID=UPI00367AB067